MEGLKENVRWKIFFWAIVNSDIRLGENVFFDYSKSFSPFVTFELEIQYYETVIKKQRQRSFEEIVDDLCSDVG